MRLGYARVSKEEQSDSLPAQVARLQGAGCDRIVEELESGRNDDRAGLAEVVAEVRAGKVVELVITRADRLGRNAAFADELLALCALQGVTVTALDGGVIESATPQGFLQARLLTTMAEVESRMLSLRLRRQFEQYRAQGRHLRRRKPFGYRGGPGHRLEPHPEHWPQALKVLQRLREIGSFTGTANDLPSWCVWTPAPSSLQAWFVNPCIRGNIGHLLKKESGKGWGQRWGEIRYGQHPALIGEADWQDLAQFLRRPSNRFQGHANEVRHGLTGLLRCASCGHSLRRNNSGGTAWWRCRHRLCEAKGGIREEAAMAAVVAASVAAADRLAAVAAAPVDEDPAVAAKRRDLEQLEGLARRNPAIASACVALRAEIESLRDRPRLTPDLMLIAERISDPAFFVGATAAEQRALFGAVLESLQVGQSGEAHALPRSW
jgi:DNA invertase Pin-like site-specific DNA recombinase